MQKPEVDGSSKPPKRSKHHSNDRVQEKYGVPKDHAIASPSKRKADSQPAISEEISKRPAIDERSSRATAGPTEETLDEASFKRRFVASFDGVPIKDEYTKDSSPVQAAETSPCRPPIHPRRLQSLPANPRTEQLDNEEFNVPRKLRRDDVLIVILLQEPFDETLAQHAIKQFVQNLRGNSGPGNDLGVSQVEALIDRLDRKRISAGLRSHIVGMLQQSLQEPWADVQARIDNLGTMSSPLSSAPHLAHATGSGKDDNITDKTKVPSQDHRSTSRQRRAMHVEIAPVNIGKVSSFKTAPPDPAESTQQPEGADQDHDSDRRTGHKKSRVQEHQHDDDSENELDVELDDPTYVPRFSRKSRENPNSISAGPSEAIISASQTNLRLYGTTFAKTSFDIYARCAITACTNGAGAPDERTALKIRDRARLVWRPVSRKEKSKWDDLFDIRHSAADVLARGHRLLKAQGLLAKLTTDNSTPDEPDHSGSARATSASELSHETSRPSHPSTIETDPNRAKTSELFPMLRQAESIPKGSQPLYVPLERPVHHMRSKKKRRSFYTVLNTPDTCTGLEVVESDIRLAFERSSLRIPGKVLRVNHNVL